MQIIFLFRVNFWPIALLLSEINLPFYGIWHHHKYEKANMDLQHNSANNQADNIHSLHVKENQYQK